MNSLINTSDYWLSVSEAAKRCGRPPQRVRVLIHSGQLIAVKRYGLWQINTRSLQNFMDGGSPHPDINRVWFRPAPDWDSAGSVP